MIDALQKVSSHNHVALLYSTRDADLYGWAKRGLSLLLDAGRGKANVRVVIAYTGNEGVSDLESAIQTMECISSRIDFSAEVLSKSDVYCQGSQALKDVVKATCRKKKARFHGGLGGS